jgi:hypothetical protein
MKEKTIKDKVEAVAEQTTKGEVEPNTAELGVSDSNENVLSKDNNGFKDNKKPKGKFLLWLDKFFKVSERGSSIRQELIGGAVNFLVLSYILVVIPGLFIDCIVKNEKV